MEQGVAYVYGEMKTTQVANIIGVIFGLYQFFYWGDVIK